MMKRLAAANSGFSLLELLIAVAVFSLLAVGMASLLRAGIQIKQRTQLHQSRMQVAEMVLEDISDNLRNAVGRRPDHFRGSRYEMVFWARQIAWYLGGEPRYQLRRMTYHYDSGAKQILKTVTDPQTDISVPYLLCEDGTGLRFEYRALDEGAGTDEWIKDWSEDDRPAAVRIELVFSETSGAETVWSRVVSIPRVKDTREE